MRGQGYAAVVVVALAGLGLTGCSVTIGTPEAAHTSVAATPTPSTLTPTQTYIADVRAGTSVDSTVTDRQIIQLGEAMCQLDAKGYGESDAEGAASGTGFDASDVQVMWNSAIRDLCPGGNA